MTEGRYLSQSGKSSSTTTTGSSTGKKCIRRTHDLTLQISRPQPRAPRFTNRLRVHTLKHAVKKTRPGRAWVIHGHHNWVRPAWIDPAAPPLLRLCHGRRVAPSHRLQRLLPPRLKQATVLPTRLCAMTRYCCLRECVSRRTYAQVVFCPRKTGQWLTVYGDMTRSSLVQTSDDIRPVCFNSIY